MSSWGLSYGTPVTLTHLFVDSASETIAMTSRFWSVSPDRCRTLFEVDSHAFNWAMYLMSGMSTWSHKLSMNSLWTAGRTVLCPFFQVMHGLDRGTFFPMTPMVRSSSDLNGIAVVQWTGNILNGNKKSMSPCTIQLRAGSVWYSTNSSDWTSDNGTIFSRVIVLPERQKHN